MIGTSYKTKTITPAWIVATRIFVGIVGALVLVSAIDPLMTWMRM